MASNIPATPRFLGLPDRLADGARPRIVLFGAGHGSTYTGTDSDGHALAPAAIRAASQEDAGLLAHHDFDLGGPLFDGGPVCCVDAGDIATATGDNARNRALIEAETRAVLAASAVPILVGGDDSVPIPFIAGFADAGPIVILQIDAHIDWRDDVEGERFGYSSPMRRASEMAHVVGMVQVGLRSVGSGSPSEITAARDYGSRFVTARAVHAEGIETALRHVEPGARVVVSLDCDGLDPGIMPGVAARAPGGLSYTQTIDLIAGVGSKARIAGLCLVELYPPADTDGLSAMTAARLLVNAIGAIVRQR